MQVGGIFLVLWVSCRRERSERNVFIVVGKCFTAAGCLKFLKNVPLKAEIFGKWKSASKASVNVFQSCREASLALPPCQGSNLDKV